MGKGVHPVAVYGLLFSAGIFIYILIYTFTSGAVGAKSAELDDLRAERVCAYLEELSQKEAEVSLDVGSLRLDSKPLRVSGGSVHNCNGNLASEGSCQGECRVISFEGHLKITEN